MAKGGTRTGVEARWPRPNAQQAQGRIPRLRSFVMEACITADLKATKGAGDRSGWLLDSGASYNFTPHRSDFTGPLLAPCASMVRVANGVLLPVEGMGTVVVLGKDGQHISITRVHWVPQMHSRLLSVSHLTGQGAEVTFKLDTCEVVRGNRVVMAGAITRTQHVGLYRLTLPSAHPYAQVAAAEVAAIPLELAHRRLNHSGPSTIKDMVRLETVTGLRVAPVGESDKGPSCRTCQESKAKRLPFPQSLRPGSAALWSWYKLTFGAQQGCPPWEGGLGMCSASWTTTLPTSRVYLLANKSAATVLTHLVPWLAMVERQSGSYSGP